LILARPNTSNKNKTASKRKTGKKIYNPMPSGILLPLKVKGAKELPGIRYFFYFMLFSSIYFILISIRPESLAFPAYATQAAVSFMYYYYGIFANYIANSTIALSLLFPLIVFSYLLAKGNRLVPIIRSLGLSRDKITLRNIGLGIVVFMAILALEFGMGIFEQVTHVSLPTNVNIVFSGMPLYLYLFTFIVAPFDEETLFRGFLVPRIGIIGSSLIFAILHFGYGSISELIAAFIFGLIAGYAFKKTRSLYVSILGHALVNFLTIALLLLSGI
jgi:CAAX amino terminal protease family.